MSMLVLNKVSSIIYKPTHPGCFFFQATLPRGDTEMFLEAMEFPTVKYMGCFMGPPINGRTFSWLTGVIFASIRWNYNPI